MKARDWPQGRLSARSVRKRRQGVRGVRPRDDGFALLEVVVAFTILVIMMVPAAALFGQVIKVAANTRDRVQAANLAMQQIDAAQVTPFATLANDATTLTTVTTTAKDAGMTYSVAQTATWLDESSANACGGVGNGAAGVAPMLVITETVTWVGMGSTHPVVSQTDIAAPASFFASTEGNLAISVTDSQNNPVVGASVTLTNTESPFDSVPATTGSTGCAFAAGLADGTYNIVVSDAGFVTPSEQATAQVSQVALGAGDTVPVSVSYAPEATVPITYTATTPILTATASTLTSYPISIFNTSLSSTDPGMTFAAAATQTLELYAYPSSYDIYPGACTDNDASTSYLLAQGQTTPVTVSLSSLSLAVTITGGKTVKNPTVTATDTSNTPSGCGTSNVLTFTPTLTANAMTIALPQGAWALAATATEVGVTPTTVVSGTFSPASVTMTTASRETAVSFP